MLFGKPRGEERREAVRQLKRWVEAHANPGERDTVMVTELNCVEEECPPVETVIALLRQGSPPRQWKIHKPAVEVTEADVIQVLGGHDDHADDDEH